MLGLVNRAGMGVARLYSDLLRVGKGTQRYEADEGTVRLTLPITTHQAFARFVAVEERDRRPLTNAEIRRISGYGRQQVLTLMRKLRDDGEVALEGRGRGAVYRPVGKVARHGRRRK